MEVYLRGGAEWVERDMLVTRRGSGASLHCHRHNHHHQRHHWHHQHYHWHHQHHHGHHWRGHVSDTEGWVALITIKRLPTGFCLTLLFINIPFCCVCENWNKKDTKNGDLIHQSVNDDDDGDPDRDDQDRVMVALYRLLRCGCSTDITASDQPHTPPPHIHVPHPHRLQKL